MRAVSQVFTTNLYQIPVKYFLDILVSLEWTSFVEFDLKFAFQGRFATYEFEVKSDFNRLLMSEEFLTIKPPDKQNSELPKHSHPKPNHPSISPLSAPPEC